MSDETTPPSDEIPAPGEPTGSDRSLDRSDRFVIGLTLGFTAPLIIFSFVAMILYYSGDQVAEAIGPPTTVANGDGNGDGGPDLDGEAIAASTGCVACHTIDGTVLVGPSWQGLFGSERTFEDGTTAVADRDYIHQSIVMPGAHVVQGFQNIMPQGYDGILEPAEIDALVDYIESLG